MNTMIFKEEERENYREVLGNKSVKVKKCFKSWRKLIDCCIKIQNKGILSSYVVIKPLYLDNSICTTWELNAEYVYVTSEELDILYSMFGECSLVVSSMTFHTIEPYCIRIAERGDLLSE